MPRSREMGQHPQQRQSARGPLNLKTPNGSDSNGRPKVEEHRRSPRSPLPECKQKKRGTRVIALETRLGHAQEELRKLKEQLASAEATKHDDDAGVAGFDETKKKQVMESNESKKVNAESPDIDAEKKPAALVAAEMAGEDTPVEEGREEEENNGDNLPPKKSIEEELMSKLAAKEEELERSREEVASLREQLGSLTKANEEMEVEKRKLKVQMEQWRKAADAATAIISGEDGYGGGVGLESRRVAERRYRHLVGPEEVVGTSGGDGTRADSPDVEDGRGGSRRRSGAGGGGAGGIRMFGDLWKKKGVLQHK